DFDEVLALDAQAAAVIAEEAEGDVDGFVGRAVAVGVGIDGEAAGDFGEVVVPVVYIRMAGHVPFFKAQPAAGFFGRFAVGDQVVHQRAQRGQVIAEVTVAADGSISHRGGSH